MTDTIKNRANKIIDQLVKTYGTIPWNWHTQQTPFQILIGTVLSQRTKDEKTDQAAKALLSKYSTCNELSKAPLEEIEEYIKPVNYYKTKAARIKEISTILVERYSGNTPESIDELMTLPGVGLKTASCVMVYGFKREAIPVDTHVHRISNRLGIIHTRTPEESEKELWKVIPTKYVRLVNELMVKHGQRICRPVKPLCHQCTVGFFCDYEPKTRKS
jgi:endonuclease-3